MEFYIFRHAHSCSNKLKEESRLKYIIRYFDTLEKEPHLTNWGIITGVRASKHKILKNIKAGEYYVSRLLRTWETAACIFPDVKTFKIGEYLREGHPKMLPQKKYILQPFSDKPGDKKEQLKRFKDFKEYVSSLKDFIPKKDVKRIQNTRIIRRNYTKKDTLKGDIKLFIQKTKFKRKKIVVICHGTIMREFISKYGTDKLNNKIKKIKKKGDPNLFGIKVLCDKNKQILSIDIIFNGYSNTKIPKKIKVLDDLC